MKALLLRASESRRVRDWLGRSALARRAVSRFMPGEGLDDGLAAAAGMAAIGISTLLTLLGEDVNDHEQADDVRNHRRSQEMTAIRRPEWMAATRGASRQARRRR